MTLAFMLAAAQCLHGPCAVEVTADGGIEARNLRTSLAEAGDEVDNVPARMLAAMPRRQRLEYEQKEKAFERRMAEHHHAIEQKYAEESGPIDRAFRRDVSENVALFDIGEHASEQAKVKTALRKKLISKYLHMRLQEAAHRAKHAPIKQLRAWERHDRLARSHRDRSRDRPDRRAEERPERREHRRRGEEVEDDGDREGRGRGRWARQRDDRERDEDEPTERDYRDRDEDRREYRDRDEDWRERDRYRRGEDGWDREDRAPRERDRDRDRWESEDRDREEEDQSRSEGHRRGQDADRESSRGLERRPSAHQAKAERSAAPEKPAQHKASAQPTHAMPAHQGAPAEHPQRP